MVDLGVAKVIKGDSRKTMTKAPGTVDFMPPESLANSLISYVAAHGHKICMTGVDTGVVMIRKLYVKYS